MSSRSTEQDFKDINIIKERLFKELDSMNKYHAERSYRLSEQRASALAKGDIDKLRALDQLMAHHMKVGANAKKEIRKIKIAIENKVIPACINQQLYNVGYIK